MAPNLEVTWLIPLTLFLVALISGPVLGKDVSRNASLSEDVMQSPKELEKPIRAKAKTTSQPCFNRTVLQKSVFRSNYVFAGKILELTEIPPENPPPIEEHEKQIYYYYNFTKKRRRDNEFLQISGSSKPKPKPMVYDAKI
ncbi:unnamed protein product, partial [Allacma fusca]